jgi:hypothetical protein
MGQGWRQFTDEFKREAVALLASSGRPLTQIASELGIAPSMLGSRQELCVSVRQRRTDRQLVVRIPYLPWGSLVAASDKPRDGQGRQCAGRLLRAGRPLMARMDG